MKRRIQQLRGGPGVSQGDPITPLRGSVASQTDQAHAWGNASEPEECHRQAAAANATSLQSEKRVPNKTGLLSRLHGFLFPDPADARNSNRESLSWLIAYFFTGGTPVAHLVRDVSLTGMYVFTEERWYLGTVVRMTLTDRREPTAERSLTLNATVVRWGNDGVGLQFLLHEGKGAKTGVVPTLSDSLEPIGRRQLEQFLERIRTGAH